MSNVVNRNSRGITLLEVLISIGILAIGLMGTLALIPAGGSFLRKAQKESRAAALIPNAFDTMVSSNLFNENALVWLVDIGSYAEQEQDLNGYYGYPSSVSQAPLGGAKIEAWYAARENPPWITGQVNVDDLEEDESPDPVTITISGPGNIEDTRTVQPADNGSWHLSLAAQDLYLSDPPVDSEEKMTIVTSGSSAGAPDAYYDQWSFSVDVGEITLNPPANPHGETGSSEAAAYRYYKKPRERDHQFGNVNADFTLPDYDADLHATNENEAQAEIEQVPLGYDRVERQITGSLWRYEAGRRQAQWRQYRDFENYFRDDPTHPIKSIESLEYSGQKFDLEDIHWRDSYWDDQPDPLRIVWADENWNPKDPNEPDFIGQNAVDWYRIRTVKDEFPIREGQEFKIDWSQSNNDAKIPTITDALSFQAYVRNWQNSLLAIGSPTPDSRVYESPRDGFLDIESELLALDDSVGNKDFPNNYRINHLGGTPIEYTLDVTIYGPHRVALVDPLMCSELEYSAQQWAAANNGLMTGYPLYDKIRKAAQFDQTTAVNGETVPFVMRRMNWNIVAGQANPSHKLAVAKNLCRPADVLAVELPDDELAASEARWELSTNNEPLRRQVDDKLSWMLTIQPEGAGTIPRTWRAGAYFDVDIVVFNNRLFPTADSQQIEGEYFFDSWWNTDTGSIKLAIDQGSGIDQDDIRRMFAAGNFVMVAPMRSSRTQRVDWLKIQNAEFTRESERTVVEIIPAEEPVTNSDPNKEITSSLFDNGTANLVTMVYQGVVAVSHRSVQITE